MAVYINDVFKFNTLSTGRRTFALRKLRPIARQYDFRRLVKRVDYSLQHEDHVRVLDWNWEAFKLKESVDPIKELDGRLDQTVTAVRDGAVNQAKGARPDDDIVAKVNEFLGQVFPAGVQAITQAPYVEELDKVELMLSKLGGELAATVVEFGLGRQVARLAELAVEYRAALENRPERMSFDEVREARAIGQNNLLSIVAMIVNEYWDDRNPEHLSARSALLAPILEQIAAVRAYLSARRAVRDIDPDTGEVLDEPASDPSEDVVADSI